jgi:hypothetical protein
MAQKTSFIRPIAAFGGEFCNDRRRDLAIFSNRPDSPARIRVSSVVTAFPSTSTALHSAGKAERASMLPGFRFLFAAIVLSMSVLVFGLGAAALLRTAHEQFTSIPSRRAPPEPVFAKANEPPMPTLALLRFEPTVLEKAPETVKVPDAVQDNAATTALPEPLAPAARTPDVTPVEPEKLAALGPEQPGPTELVKPDVPAVDAAPVAAAAPGEAPAAASDEVKPAAIAETSPSPPAIAPATAAEPATETPSPEGNIAATKIATLGGPAVTTEQPASFKKPGAKPDRSAARKRAARARERRRIAAARRALLAQQAAAQQQANPFDPQVATRAKR